MCPQGSPRLPCAPGAHSDCLLIIISLPGLTLLIRLCFLRSPKSSSQGLLVGEPKTKMASFTLCKTLIHKLQSVKFPLMTQQLSCGPDSAFHSRPTKTIFPSSLGSPTGEPGHKKGGKRERNKQTQLHQDPHKANKFIFISLMTLIIEKCIRYLYFLTLE